MDVVHFVSHSFSVTDACICVVLLLGGGFAWFCSSHVGSI